MAKIITDKEMNQIINSAVNGDAIDCSDAYLHFLEDLGTLIADHFGGERSTVTFTEEDNLGYTVAFRVNECVPADGGVYKTFDTDVTWKEGKEL